MLVEEFGWFKEILKEFMRKNTILNEKKNKWISRI